MCPAVHGTGVTKAEELGLAGLKVYPHPRTPVHSEVGIAMWPHWNQEEGRAASTGTCLVRLATCGAHVWDGVSSIRTVGLVLFFVAWSHIDQSDLKLAVY